MPGRYYWYPGNLLLTNIYFAFKPSPRNELPNFRPANVERIIRREVHTVSEHTIVVYRGRVQGRALTAQTESGINKALEADRGATNRIAAREPQSDTRVNVSIPLAVVRDTLPLFVKPQDGMPVRACCLPALYCYSY